jgi:hypothetical protein
MECPNCGTWYPPDPETGHDVDELCPNCKALEPHFETPMDGAEPIEERPPALVEFERTGDKTFLEDIADDDECPF